MLDNDTHFSLDPALELELDKFYYGHLDDITTPISNSSTLTNKNSTSSYHSFFSLNTSVTNTATSANTSSPSYFDYSLPTSPLDGINGVSSTTGDPSSIATPPIATSLSETPISTSPLATTVSSSTSTATTTPFGATTPSGISKQFQCSQCPLSFRRNHDLKRHVKIHLPVRPYTCEQCSKAFNRKDALRRHVISKACKMASGRPEKSRSASLTSANKSHDISHHNTNHKSLINSIGSSSNASSKDDGNAAITKLLASHSSIDSMTTSSNSSAEIRSPLIQQEINTISSPPRQAAQAAPGFLNLNQQQPLDSLESFFFDSVTPSSINNLMNSPTTVPTTETVSSITPVKIITDNGSITTERNSMLSPFALIKSETPAPTPPGPKKVIRASNKSSGELSTTQNQISETANSVDSEWPDLYDPTSFTQGFQTPSGGSSQPDAGTNYWGSPWI